MPLQGRIATGSRGVFADGLPVARRGDAIDHPGALITGGDARVHADGASRAVARAGDGYVCPTTEPATGQPHVGGALLPAPGRTVRAGGRPVACRGDATLCAGPPSPAPGPDGARGGRPDGSGCVALWARYQAEALRLIAPGDHDHRARNRIISGAYADLYLRNRSFLWAGLAGFASKQVGCAMAHADQTRRGGAGVVAGLALPPLAAGAALADLGRAAGADPMLDALGDGNRSLFLDAYPMHRFYEEQGWARFSRCAGERPGGVPPWARKAFEATHRAETDPGDVARRAARLDSLRWMALHEQITILQRDVYTDARTRALLDANESPALAPFGTLPATAIMAPGCTDPTGGQRTTPFGRGGRRALYDVHERMSWIFDDVGRLYTRIEATGEAEGHLEEIRARGATAGAEYPARNVPGGAR